MDNSDKRDPGGTNQITRRSLLDWLGKTAVMGLGSELLLACDERFDSRLYGRGGVDGGREQPGSCGPRVPDDGGQTGAEDDGGADEAGAPDAAAGDSGAGEEIDGGTQSGFTFAPGPDKPIYEGFEIYVADPQDLNATLRNWKLQVGGLVEKELVLSFADLLKLDRADQITDFHCTVGWSVLDVPWNGVRLSTLLGMAKPLPDATHVTFRTITDVYNESLTLAEAMEPKTLLAFGVAGSTLPLEHGFPARLVIPRKFGYKNAKYVYRIELDNKPVAGFWVQAGFPYEADVPAERLRPGKY